MNWTNARHAEVFLALAEVGASHHHGPDQAERLARLETEHDNLRAAMAYLLEERDRSDNALRLGVALQWFWYQRGSFNEGLNQTAKHSSVWVRTSRAHCGLGALLPWQRCI